MTDILQCGYCGFTPDDEYDILRQICNFSDEKIMELHMTDDSCELVKLLKRIIDLLECE